MHVRVRQQLTLGAFRQRVSDKRCIFLRQPCAYVQFTAETHEKEETE